ncbi:MAG: hypothetical protein IH995_08740, partial [Proteobacteria bacterium]|nr:hypothetical protein [Pseudomonadota bacterium]
GALFSALFNLADRLKARYLFAASALAGSIFNAAIPLLDTGPETAIALRMLTGVSLAGVYPPGMKIMATWCGKDRGLGIGLLVGALALGSALPHLLNGIPLFGSGGMPPWRMVLLATSIMAACGGLITILFVKSGPLEGPPAPFNWRFAAKAFTHAPTRLANFGYLGHMWELYAMWAWFFAFFGDSLVREGFMDTNRAAQMLGFKAQTPLKEGVRETVHWYRERNLL